MRAKYVDHDRVEVDSDDTDYSELLAWAGFGKSRLQAGSKKSDQSSAESSEPVKSKRPQYDNPPGPYDSPSDGYDSTYTAAPGPYDSPESDTENEESAADKVHSRFVCRFSSQVVSVSLSSAWDCPVQYYFRVFFDSYFASG